MLIKPPQIVGVISLLVVTRSFCWFLYMMIDASTLTMQMMCHNILMFLDHCILFYLINSVWKLTHPTFQCSRVQTPACTRQTVFDAVSLDYRSVTVIVDATAAATPEMHLGRYFYWLVYTNNPFLYALIASVFC